MLNCYVLLEKKEYSFQMRRYNMNKELELTKESLLSCPFTLSCNLPQGKEVCDFPSYKICPEYQSGLNKLKSSSKILY